MRLLAALSLPAALFLSGCASALHTAAANNDAAEVRRLIAGGANIEAYNERFDKWTPLHYAAARGNNEAVKALLEAGADVRHRSSGGTARQIAQDFKHFDTAALIAAYENSGAPATAATAPPPAAEVVPAASPREPISDVDSPVIRAQPRPDDFALVIGIEDYQSVPKADWGARDAKAVRKNLEALGFPPRNVISLEGSQATGNKLKSYLEEWLPLNVKPTSTLFVYYSGHGAPDPKSGEAYLLPWDGDASFLKSTAYPVKKLYADLAKIKAKRVIVALDACFSGAGGRSVLAQGARPLVTKTEDLKPAGAITVLAASSGDEITGALNDQGHGMFTYFLLKGLAAGKTSARELMEFVSPKVQDEARRQNRQQTPVILGEDAKL